MLKSLWILALGAVLLAGCTVEAPKAKSESGAPAPEANAPVASTTPDANAPAPEQEIKELEDGKKLDEAEKAAFEKDPSDAQKKKYVDAALKYGTTVMLANSLPPKVKYPDSLKLFREVLKADPENAEAKENVKVIEDIYKSMGRPVPI